MREPFTRLGLAPQPGALAVRGRIRILTHRRTLQYLGLVLALVFLSIVTPQTDLRSDAMFSAAAGTVAANLATLAGLVALLYYSGTSNLLYLFTGVGFLGAALLDGFQVTTVWLARAGPWQSAAAESGSRWFLPAWLWLGVWVAGHEQRLARLMRKARPAMYMGAAGLALLCLLCARTSPPAASTGALLGHGASAILFFGAIESLLRRRIWPHDTFEHCLMLSMILGFLGNTLFLGNSPEIYSAELTMAEHLRNLAYLATLVGLVIAMRQSLQRAEDLAVSLEQRVEERTKESAEARLAAERAREEAEQARRVEQEANQQLRAQIAERLAAEQALRESESLLQMALSAGQIGVWTWHVGDGSCTWDSQVYDIFGQRPGGFAPTFENVLGLIHPEDAPMVRERAQRAVVEAAEMDLDCRVKRPDSSIRYLMSRGTAVTDAAGNTVRMIGTLVDVTEHKRGEEELRRRGQELSQMVKALSCLYEIASLLEQSETPLERIYERIAELLPVSWHDPQNTFARLEAGGREYRSSGWRDTGCKECTSIVVAGEKLGRLEIGFASAVPEHEPFRQEEIRITRMVAASLARTIEYRRAGENLRRSERRYRGLFDHMIGGCALHEIIVDETGKATNYRFLETNAAFERLARLRAGAAVGKTAREVFPGIEPDWIETCGQVALGGDPVRLERYFAPLGRYFDMAVFSPEKGRFAIVLNDVTERRQAEAERAAESNLLRTLIDNLPDSVYVKDTEARYLINNKANLDRLGLAGEGQARGKTVFDFFPEEHARLYDADDRTVLESRVSIFDREEPYRDAAGCLCDYATTKVPLFDADGKVIGLVGISRDITGRKRAAEALEQKAKELAASNAELEQFVYAASHDLQEPLRMIAGFTQLLSRRYQGKFDGDADEFMRFIVEGAERMQTLIRDLLAYSRAGRTSLNAERVDLRECVAASLANLRATLEENGADVEVSPLPEYVGRRSQLIQLFQNLIGNAVKYHGVEPPRVRVSAERQGGEWLFAVQDNGIGIDPQYAGQVFELFRRLHGRNEYSGTGIGLAICKKIVEGHGGRIWVDSQPGQGATFRFTLPHEDGPAADTLESAGDTSFSG
jgi:PAS domain S-box-containing protein